MQRFLGMCNVFRAFVPKMAEYSAPLSMLSKKDTEWEWTQEHQDAFDNLKQAFVVIGLHRGNVFLSSGFYYASNQLIKVNVTPKTKKECQELVDKMLSTGATHYVDEFTGEIMPSASYNGDDNIEDLVHQYDFAGLFRNAKPFGDVN